MTKNINKDELNAMENSEKNDDVNVVENESLEQRVRNMKKEYENIDIPDNLESIVKTGIDKGKFMRRQKMRNKVMKRTGIAVAAACALVIALPNTNAAVCHAMEQIPGLGAIVKVVTFREYKYDDGKYVADVDVPKVKTENKQENETEITSGMSEVNADIDEIATKAEEAFKKSVALDSGANELKISHEVVTNNDKYITLKLTVNNVAADAMETDYYYTVDKKTGEQVKLGDLFKANTDYQKIISDNIKKQMKEQMAKDEMKTYFVDTDMPSEDFKQIAADQNFYFDENGNLVIAMGEATVAPASMGNVSFTIPKDVVSQYYK